MNSSDGQLVRASASGAVDSGFDSESGQTNDFKIGMHSFPTWLFALIGLCEEQAGKFTCALGKALSGIPPSRRRQIAL